MNFPQYYNNERFMADNMHSRAAASLCHSEYRPPPDIQLFYLLEIINDLSVLGQTQFKIFNSIIDADVIDRLRNLGYHVNNSSTDLSLVIRWDN